jgi:glycosyltransferase involved in cell wall biosynthesis
VDATITVSELIAQELAVRYAIPPPLVLRNCVPLLPEGEKGFPLRGALGLGRRARIVLHTGSLVSFGRALRELILAFRYLAEGFHLVFLGEGPLETELRELARSHDLEGRVHFQRPVLPHQLIPTMRGADLGAVMIRGEDAASYHFSLPNKLFEAIAAGLPVVASGLPEISRVVLGYEIGIICQPDDPVDIARAIRESLSPERYGTFKANLKRAQQELNWERESQKLSDLYRRLVGNRA